MLKKKIILCVTIFTLALTPSFAKRKTKKKTKTKQTSLTLVDAVKIVEEKEIQRLAKEISQPASKVFNLIRAEVPNQHILFEYTGIDSIHEALKISGGNKAPLTYCTYNTICGGTFCEQSALKCYRVTDKKWVDVTNKVLPSEFEDYFEKKFTQWRASNYAAGEDKTKQCPYVSQIQFSIKDKMPYIRLGGFCGLDESEKAFHLGHIELKDGKLILVEEE